MKKGAKIIKMPEQKVREMSDGQKVVILERRIKEAEAALEIKDKLIKTQAETMQALEKILEEEKNAKIKDEVAKTPEEWKEEKEMMLKRMRNLELNNIYWTSTVQAIASLTGVNK